MGFKPQHYSDLQWYEQDVPLISPYVINRDNTRDSGEQCSQHSNLTTQDRRWHGQIFFQMWYQISGENRAYESKHLVNPVEIQLLAQGKMEKC